MGLLNCVTRTSFNNIHQYGYAIEDVIWLDQVISFLNVITYALIELLFNLMTAATLTELHYA